MEIYRSAQTSDATYAAARAAWAAGQEKLPQGLAGLLPSATLSGSTEYNVRDFRPRDGVTPSTTSRFNSNNIQLSVTQPIYRPQNMASYGQAKTQVAQTDALFSLAAQDLILRVAQAYFDVLLAENTVELAQAQLVAFGQQLEQAKRNFEVGTATITDTHDAQSRYDLTAAGEIAAKNDLEVKKRALAQITGRPVPPLSRVGPKFPLVAPDPVNMEAWVKQALESNLSVVVSQSNLEFSTQDVARNRAGHLPTVDAFASYSDAGSGIGGVGISGTDTNTTVVGIQVAIPIYQGGIINSRVREAVANEERARQDLEAARRNAELAARQAYLGATSSLAQVGAYATALISAQSSLDSTRLGQEVGIRTQVDVLNAQQLVFQVRRDRAQAIYNYVISLLRLKAAVGKLTEDDVVRLNLGLERN